MIKVKLEKLSDDKFNGEHPNGIIAGSKREGDIPYDVTVGQSLMLFAKFKTSGFPIFWTSTVTKIVKKNKKSVIFKTLNSTYKLTYEK